MDNIVRTMRFEWDKEKDRINRRKDRIRQDDDEIIRIISARKAMPRERAIYAQND